MKKRTRYSAEFKAEVVLKMFKEEQTVTQLASDYGIHPNQLFKWKKQFLQNMTLVFRDENQPVHDLKIQHDKQVQELYTEIGKLTTQVNWLKKKCGRIDQV